MAVDIRAVVTCSLGTLISGSLSDDYLQGVGLIKTRGNAVISGTITPAVGTVVTFSYTKGGVTRNIPRKLRVLSSFADPYRRTTTVELGCKLTYLADLKDPIDWSVFDDPENDEYNEDDSKIVTLPISAASVMSKCLTELGLSASSSPLTNNFSTGSFDFSPGYVNVLSDLLVSESYFGYLDFNEVLQIVDLKTANNAGPVYIESDIIDLGPINSGQLPGEAVVVSYSTLKLRNPEVNTVPDPEDPVDQESRERLARLNWERTESVTGPNSYSLGSRVYTGMERTVTETRYTQIKDQNVPTRTITTSTASTAKIGGSIGTAYVTAGIGFAASDGVEQQDVTLYSYDRDGNRTAEETTTFVNGLKFFGDLSLEYVFSSTDFVTFSQGLIELSKRVVTYNKIGDVEQQIESNYIAWINSISGQQAVAEYRQSGLLADSSSVSAFANSVVRAGLVHVSTRTSISTAGLTRGRPANVLNASLNKDAAKQSGSANENVDPNNGYRTASKAELELALGSPTAQRRIELSMPYAPDDRFTGSAGGPYTATPSDAEAKANNFGRVQNRLLLGNRSGMNLQLAPERLPAAPFASMYVQANGLTAQYRANGNQWAFDSNGIACSTDALFWAAVGGTGTFWFPVAPGITTLPVTPAPVDGVLTPTTTTLPYNETVSLRAAAGPTITVTPFTYALELLTEVPPLKARAKVSVFVDYLDGESGSFTFTGNDAGLLRVYTMTAEPGSFTLTGNAADLSID